MDTWDEVDALRAALHRAPAQVAESASQLRCQPVLPVTELPDLFSR